ncbi:transmembrane protein 272-like [Menidia menidia]
MAAPTADRPVRITIGTVWNLQIQPQPRRLPRLSVAAVIIGAVLVVARITFGAVYFRDCPQHPNIPIYLLGLALVSLLSVSFVTLPCESEAAPSRRHPKGFKACLMFLMSVFILIWILLGDVWVFSIYQPNYDPSAADGLYCNRTLYTFAFWNAILETFSLGVELAKFCKGMLVYVVLSPIPANTNLHGHV